MRVSDLRPIGDRILVRPDSRIQVSTGGIAIPESVTRDNPNYFSMTGVVVALGDGVRRHLWLCLCCSTVHPDQVGDCAVCHNSLKANTRLYQVDEALRPFDVKQHDRVLFNRFAGKQLEVEKPFKQPYYDPTERVLMMRESDVLAIVDGRHRILPGYEAPKHGRITEGVTR